MKYYSPIWGKLSLFRQFVFDWLDYCFGKVYVMAEELFQFLLKLKEDGVDLSEVDVWFDELPESNLNGFLGLVRIFSYDPEDKEITLTEK